MMDVALSILALIAGGLTLELFATAVPTLSDDHPFDHRSSCLGEEIQAGNPS
jgi:hypothetical protein